MVAQLMKYIKPLTLLSTFLAISSLFAADGDPGEDREMAALRQWIMSKRMVTVKERGGNFAISGDVRAEFDATNEVRNGVNQRGRNSANPLIPFDDYAVKASLMYDYRTDFTWVTIKMKYDNAAGSITGTTNRISLDRAFLGFRIFEGANYTGDMEVGRRKLGYTFDSKIQYKAIMDGILLKFDSTSDRFGDFYAYAGPFVVNDQINQYGYVAETGLLSMFDTGFYSKLSWIDWNTASQRTSVQDQVFRFQNIQSLWGYKFVPTIILPKKVTAIYAAFLNNLAAEGVEQTHYQKENWAWYAGVAVGEVRQKGDWAMEWNYQWVQAQSIIAFDMDGIGRGNAPGQGFYATNNNGTGTPTTSATAVGQNNFRGWQFELIYLISNTITIDQTFKMTSTLNKNIGPNIHYKQYSLEFIYAF